MPLQLNPKMLVKLRQNTAFLTALAVVAALAAAFAAAVLIIPVKATARLAFGRFCVSQKR